MGFFGNRIGSLWANYGRYAAVLAASAATSGAAGAMGVGMGGSTAATAAGVTAGVATNDALAPPPQMGEGGGDTLLSPPTAAAAKADNPDLAAKNARDRARLLAGGREGTKKSTLGSTGGNYATTSLLGG